MAKVKVELIKGPNFELVEKKAYGLLHQILIKKANEDRDDPIKKTGS